jgi:hypothetical protein
MYCEVVDGLQCLMAAKQKAWGIKESEDVDDQAARAQQLIRDKFSEAAKMATSSRKRDKQVETNRADGPISSATIAHRLDCSDYGIRGCSICQGHRCHV